ncbi:MAG: hypothetical protein ABGY96_08255 [bacterium]|nr:hypothetical protein [Gammaproteobacteria bacterium]HIL97460.1 hypothetical protein [Pseudomonadales bacterium]
MKFISLGAVLLGMAPFCLGHPAMTTLTSKGAADVAEPPTSSSEIDELQDSLAILKTEYDRRISDLERRLELAEQRVTQTVSRNEVIAEQAMEALELAEEAALAPNPMTRSANTFNPAIGVILVGTVASQTSHQDYQVPGFSLPEEAGPVDEGFSLGESELNFNANVDDKFFANLTFALASDDGETEVELEEAYIQSLAIPGGINVTAGRFFSGMGYLNGFHTHTDNFADRPLSYEVFLGGQYKDDGIQVRWLLPTQHYFEIGGEILRGDAFPAAGAAHDGMGAWSLFADTGGDIGFSGSWQVGIGVLHTTVIDRAVNASNEESTLFTGDSDLYNLNFVWKWSPNGNPVYTNFKLQGEYFWREENGQLDTANYSGDQSGWYLQGFWQFKPQWRIGYRYDQVRADNKNVAGTSLEARNDSTDRNSLTLEWSNSEFSRIRLQLNAGQSGLENDSRWVLQYLHSLGAHGAHRF